MSQKIEKWVGVLLNLLDEDSLNGNGRIVKTTFSNIDNDIVKAVTGNPKSDFREFLREAPDAMQNLYGLTVKRIPGGGLEAVNLIIPYEIGKELAHELLSSGKESGNAQDELKNATGSLRGKIEDCLNIDILKSQWLSNFKEGFKSAVYNKKRFGFSTSSFNFSLINENISYKGKESQLETLLAGSKTSSLSAKFQVLWNIEVECVANGGRLAAGMLANPDITIVGKRSLVERDELRIAALELKKDNRVEHLFKALSQAAAYRAIANEVWIVAPGLRESEFKSVEQYHSFVSQCRDNGFGVLTLDLSDNRSDVEGIQVIVAPRDNSIMNPSLQRRVIEELDWGYCHKCARFYSDSAIIKDVESSDIEATADCGWLIGEECARRLEERVLAKLASGGDEPEDRE